MKKLFAILAAAAAIVLAGCAVSSCAPYEHGTVTYHIKIVNFEDNWDVLAYSIDKGFEEGGLQKMEVGVHYWTLSGEKNACNKKAEAVFQARCKAIDKDRSLAGGLALKGATVKLLYSFTGEYELSSYTFVEENK